jgi:hypothetical protein
MPVPIPSGKSGFIKSLQPWMITLFSSRVLGMGNATEQLVQVVDEAEAKDGRQPPTFVDIRLRRQGRAKG